jgi:hypothetical protein
LRWKLNYLIYVINCQLEINKELTISLEALLDPLTIKIYWLYSCTWCEFDQGNYWSSGAHKDYSIDFALLSAPFGQNLNTAAINHSTPCRQNNNNWADRTHQSLRGCYAWSQNVLSLAPCFNFACRARPWVVVKLLNCWGPLVAALQADCFILYFGKHYSVLSVCMWGGAAAAGCCFGIIYLARVSNGNIMGAECKCCAFRKCDLLPCPTKQ